MIETLLLAVLFTLVDPAGDATGAGDLSLPSAEVFQVPGVFDVRALTVLDQEGFSFDLRMGEVTNPWGLPLGFSLPIVELYLVTREQGGKRELLPGSGMRLPDEVRWHYAFRLSGDRLELWRAETDGSLLEVSERYRASLRTEGSTLMVTSSLPRPRHFSLYGAVGGYDPWDASGWRRVMPEAEAFAFGSAYQAATGIRAVDILADSAQTQASAMRSGALPEIRPPSQQAQWPPVIAAGIALALLGGLARVVVGRRGSRRRQPTIGYGAPRPAAPERRALEPVDLLAGLSPPRSDPASKASSAGSAEAHPPRRVRAYTPPTDTDESQATRPLGRVGVFDAPEQVGSHLVTRRVRAYPLPERNDKREAPRTRRVGVYQVPEDALGGTRPTDTATTDAERGDS